MGGRGWLGEGEMMLLLWVLGRVGVFWVICRLITSPDNSGVIALSGTAAIVAALYLAGHAMGG